MTDIPNNSTVSILPIPTNYNGYRFRSRLEARWGKYFDKISIPYDYEFEGYEIEPGVCYLPDFWLPSHKCYAEVKPEPINQETADKLFQFVDYSKKALLFLVGTPNYVPYIIALPYLKGEHEGEKPEIPYKDSRIDCKCGVAFPFNADVRIPPNIVLACVEIWYGWIKDGRFWVFPCGNEATSRKDWDNRDPVIASRTNWVKKGKDVVIW